LEQLSLEREDPPPPHPEEVGTVGVVGGVAGGVGVQVVFRAIFSLGVSFGSKVLREVMRKR
jgi:hypothetical protein